MYSPLAFQRREVIIKRIFLFLILIFILIIPSSTAHKLPEKKAEPTYLVAFKGGKIFPDDFIQKLKKIEIKPSDLPKEKDSLKRFVMDILDQMIEERLILIYGKEHGIKLNELETEAEVKQIKEEYAKESLEDFLARKGLTLKEWKEEIKKELLIDNIIFQEVGMDITVSEEELQRYYLKHKEEFHTPARIRALQILLKDKKSAKLVYRKLKSKRKKEKFSELAKEFSVAPEAKIGGDLGYFSKDEMPLFFSSLFSMKVGEVSPIIKSQYGFHIFKVIDKKKEGILPYSDVRKSIKNKILLQKQRDRYKKWINNIKKEAVINFNPVAINKFVSFLITHYRKTE